jgi:hypothetical protein
LCDGSPKILREKVISALEFFNIEKDAKIRRNAHKGPFFGFFGRFETKNDVFDGRKCFLGSVLY